MGCESGRQETRACNPCLPRFVLIFSRDDEFRKTGLVEHLVGMTTRTGAMEPIGIPSTHPRVLDIASYPTPLDFGHSGGRWAADQGDHEQAALTPIGLWIVLLGMSLGKGLPNVQRVRSRFAREPSLIPPRSADRGRPVAGWPRNLPTVTKRIVDSSELPPMLLLDGVDLRRTGSNCARDR